MKKHPVIARILAGTTVACDYERIEFPKTTEVVLYRTKPHGRWQAKATFKYNNNNCEIIVDHAFITNYNPSPKQIKEIDNAGNN